MSAAGYFPKPAGTASITSRKAKSNRSLEVQELLRKARSKTQQATYRNRLSRSSATAAYSPIQHSKRVEQQLGRPDSPCHSPIIQGVHDQRHYESRANSPFQEAAPRRRARVPRASQTYSKKKTSHKQYLSDHEPEQALSQQKASRKIQKSRKRKKL